MASSSGGLLGAIHETRRAVCRWTERQALKVLEQYVVKRAKMLDYPTFRAHGLGSGPNEAFCRMPAARLKGSRLLTGATPWGWSQRAYPLTHGQ